MEGCNYGRYWLNPQVSGPINLLIPGFQRGDLLPFAVLLFPHLYVALPFFTLHGFHPHTHTQSSPNNSMRMKERRKIHLYLTMSKHRLV